MRHMTSRLYSQWYSLGIVLVVGAVLSACGLVEETGDRVETVDEAVTLLQDLDQHAAWETVADGIDALDEQDEGYVAQIRLKVGTVGATGDLPETLDQDITITLRTDARHNAQIDWVSGGDQQTYLLESISRSTAPTVAYRVYRVEDGHYTCSTENAEELLLQTGLRSIFEQYAANATGVQTLTIADEDEERAVIGRDTTHYVIKSRLPEALNVLGRFDNLALKTRIEQTETFELSGDFDLDQDTGALLRFTSVYAETVSQRRTEFSFEITQWGDVADLTLPTDETILRPCPSN